MLGSLFSDDKDVYIYIYVYGAITWKLEEIFPDSKVYGANMGPTWGRQDPGGPMLAHGPCYLGSASYIEWALMWFPLMWDFLTFFTWHHVIIVLMIVD